MYELAKLFPISDAKYRQVVDDDATAIAFARDFLANRGDAGSFVLIGDDGRVAAKIRVYSDVRTKVEEL